VTDFTFPTHWSKALDTLDISTQSSSTPSGESEDWAEVTKHFANRGYLLVFLRPQAQGVSTRLDFALPQKERSASFGRELAARLRVLGARDAELSAEGPPAVVKAGFGDLDEDRAQTILTLFLKVRDYIARLEDDPTAPSPLEQVDAYPPQDNEAHAGETTFSSMAVEGDEDSEQDREEPPAKKAPSGGGFEMIGKNAPAQSSSERSSGSSSDSERARDKGEEIAGDEDFLAVVASDVFVSRGAVHMALALSNFPGGSRYDAILNALRKIFRTSFDARVEPTESVEHNLNVSDQRTLCFILQPALTTAKDEDVRRLRDDISDYCARLRKFGELRLSLEEFLGIRGATKTPERREERRESRREEPRRERDEEPASGGFVLGFGSDDAPEKERREERREEPRRERDARDEEEPQGLTLSFDDAGSAGGKDVLQAGNFEDARLKREDATTALVDVVLRHPGYSDKNICQVLTILLSIDYSKALHTIQQAPCVIAWGIGMERALTFRNVIEGAGGKVLLVEPGTFGNA
jgi:hypothetical protein